MPDVSVVIPTRDRPAALATAVADALGQDDVDVEVIVVDDGSRHPVELAGDRRLRVLRNERPAGPGAARNRGAAVAGSPWIAFLDDDDRWSPTKLAHQLAAAGEAGWVTAGTLVVDAFDRVLRREPPPPARASFRHRNQLSTCSSVVVRADLLRDVGGFDETLPALEDWELWIRLAARSPLASVADPLVRYRRLPGGRSHDAAAVDAAFARVVALHDLAELDRRWALLYAGEMHQRSGNRLPAAARFLAAGRLTREPRSFLRAAAALAWPGSIALRDRRARRRHVDHS